MSDWLIFLIAVAIFILPILLVTRPKWIKAPFVAVWRSITPNIGELKEQRDIPGLIKAIDICHHKDNPARGKEAAIALGELGPDAIQPILQLMENSYVGDLDYPGIALGVIGLAATQPLLDAIQKGGSIYRRRAVNALFIAARENPEILTVLKSGKAWLIIKKARQSFTKPYEKWDFDPLMSMIDPQGTVEIRSLEEKNRIKRQRSKEMHDWIQILQTGAYEQRLNACTKLGELGDPEAVPTLENLTNIGPENIELLFDGGQKERMKIAYPNGRIPAPEKEMLWRSLAPRSEELGALASTAIVKIKNKSTG